MVAATIVAALILRPANVTLQTGAVSSVAALQMLSEATGEKLRISPELADEVLILKVDQRPISEVKDALARVLHADWTTQQNGTQVIHRQETERKRLQDQEHASTAAVISKHLLEIERFLARTTTPLDRAKFVLKDLERVKDEMSSGRASQLAQANNGTYEPELNSAAKLLAKEFLVSMGSDAIARLPLDTPTVWSTTPTLAQRMMPGSCSEAVKRYVETEAMLAQIAGDRTVEGGVDGWLDRQLPTTAQMKVPVGDVLVMVQRMDEWVWALCSVFDQKGQLRVRDNVRIPLAVDGFNPGIVTRPLPSTGDPQWHQLSALSSQLSKIKLDSLEQPELSQDVRAAVLNPERSDPLGFSALDGLVGMATARGKNLIACVPDDIHTAARLSEREDQIDLRRFEAEAKRFGAEFTLTEHYLLVQPSRPLYCERVRLPRKSLGKFLRASIDQASLPFRDYCLFRYETNKGAPVHLSRNYWRYLRVLGGPDVNLNIRLHRDQYALLGSLSDPVYHRLLQGGFLDLGRTTPLQHKLAWLTPSRSMPTLMQGEASAFPDQLLTATEICPNGRLDRVVLTVKTEETQAFTAARGSKHPTEGYHFDLERFASYLSQQMYSNEVTFDEATQGSWLTGTRLAYRVRFQFPNGLFWEETQPDVPTYADVPRTFAELPETTRDAVKRRTEQLLRELKGGT